MSSKFPQSRVPRIDMRIFPCPLLFLGLLLTGCNQPIHDKTPTAAQPKQPSTAKGPAKNKTASIPSQKKSAPTSPSHSSVQPPAPEPIAPPAQQRLLASARVPVELTLQATVGQDHRVVVSGTSNLPRGTKLSVLFTQLVTTPYKSNPIVNERGDYTTEPLGNPEVGILPTKYEISVSVDPLGKQPASVREHFEGRDENLQGPLLVTEGQRQFIEVTMPLDLRLEDPNLPIAEQRKIHAQHVENYAAELKALHAELVEKQSIIEARSFDTTVNYDWPAVKSRLDKLRLDRRMRGEFRELNYAFMHAEQKLEYYQQVLEHKQGQYWESANEEFKKILREAEAALQQFQKR